MLNTVYGIYKEGNVIFDEPVNAPDESNVIVVFLGTQISWETQNKNKLSDMFDILGAWEDTRDTETIISEIENSRVSKTANIKL